MTSRSDVTPIPTTVIDRYRRIRAKAAATEGPEHALAESLLRRMKKRHPSIERLADALDERDKRRAAHRGVGWEPPGPPSPGDWADMLRRASLRVIGVDPIAWANERITEAANAALYHMYDDGDAWPPGGELMTLLDQLREDVEVEIEDVQDDDGETLHEFRIVIPPDVWTRVSSTRGGPGEFVKFLREIMDGTGGEDDESDDAGNDEEE